jgi:hypothetical protein
MQAQSKTGLAHEQTIPCNVQEHVMAGVAGTKTSNQKPPPPPPTIEAGGSFVLSDISSQVNSRINVPGMMVAGIIKPSAGTQKPHTAKQEAATRTGLVMIDPFAGF